MEIRLEEPFKSKWKKGYLRTGPEGRRLVDLFNSDQDRTTISYARYLMTIKLGYEIPDNLVVDHKDDNKTNDDINNLQVVTEEYNRLKEQYRYIMTEQECYGYHCAYCETAFILTRREKDKREKSSKTGLAFCSRSCSATYNSMAGNLSGLSKKS